jgi:plasmid stability protein
MPKRPEKVTLTIPVDLRRKARAKAILEGKSLSQAVRELLRLWLAGEVELPAQKEQALEQD